MLHRICYLCNTEIQRCEEILQCTHHCDIGQVKFSDTSTTPRKFSDTFSEFSTCWFRILNMFFSNSHQVFYSSRHVFSTLNMFFSNSPHILFQFSTRSFPIFGMHFSNSRHVFFQFSTTFCPLWLAMFPRAVN